MKQDAFEDFDKDKDGLVSLDEIRLHLLETGKGISEIELQDLFNKADTNGDGKIDVTEFTKLVELLSARDCSIDPALLKAFDQLVWSAKRRCGQHCEQVARIYQTLSSRFALRRRTPTRTGRLT